MIKQESINEIYALKLITKNADINSDKITQVKEKLFNYSSWKLDECQNL